MKEQKRLRKSMKKEKGITLIALVITVIVLLILAGVSINGILGQGSVVNQAKEAKTQTNNKQEEESISVAMAEAVGNSDLSREVIEGELEDLIDTQVIMGNGPWIVKGNSGIFYTVSPGGDVAEMSSEEVGIFIEDSTIENKKNNVLSKDSIVTIKDSLGNYVRVPKGFKISSESGNTVQDGIVIEDDATQNQFVWVPVGTVKTDAEGTKVTIPLGRYEDFTGTPTPKQDTSKGYVYTTKGHIITYNYDNGNIGHFYEFASDTESKSAVGKTYENTKAKDIKEFVKSANTNGGYYIGRYEAGVEGFTESPSTDNPDKKTEWTGYTANGGGDPTMVCKSGAQVWNWVTQKKAASLCQNMYSTGAGVESDLMNSYAWDTAIIFIQQCGNKKNSSTYYNQSGKLTITSEPSKTGQGKLASPSGGEQSTEDEQCKIYDMAGNVREWTTENGFLSDYPCVSRGGNCWSSFATTYRCGYIISDTSLGVGFRPILYVNV